MVNSFLLLGSGLTASVIWLTLLVTTNFNPYTVGAGLLAMIWASDRIGAR